MRRTFTVVVAALALAGCWYYPSDVPAVEAGAGVRPSGFRDGIYCPFVPDEYVPTLSTDCARMEWDRETRTYRIEATDPLGGPPDEDEPAEPATLTAAPLGRGLHVFEYAGLDPDTAPYVLFTVVARQQGYVALVGPDDDVEALGALADAEGVTLNESGDLITAGDPAAVRAFLRRVADRALDAPPAEGVSNPLSAINPEDEPQIFRPIYILRVGALRGGPEDEAAIRRNVRALERAAERAARR